MLLSRLLLATLGVVFATTASIADPYPSKPVRVVIPFSAGGVTDVVARVVAAELSKRLGQQFVIENQPGAGGNIAMGAVARAPADGYTVLFSASSIFVNPYLYQKVPFDVEKDFIPVTKVASTPNVWVVNPKFPANSMQELIELIKKEPGKHNVASSGAGTTPSLSIEMLKVGLKLDFATIAFKGSGPSSQSILAGHTPIGCMALGTSLGLIKEGGLRALAVTGGKRSASMPDLPTLAELGINDQESETITGAFLPAGTPAAIVQLLQREIAAIVNTPEIKARLLALGVEAEGDSQEAFAAYTKAELEKWKKIIDEAKIEKM